MPILWGDDYRERFNQGHCPMCHRTCWGDPDLECSHCGWEQGDEARYAAEEAEEDQE